MPWGGTEPPFDFTPLNVGSGWLPSPEAWIGQTVEAQRDDPSSTLSLYRRALQLRHTLPALGDGDLSWRQASEGVLVFTRTPGFVCTVNTGDQPVVLPRPGEPLLASDGRMPEPGGEDFELAADTAVWWSSPTA
jgi:alpha-glucosidase